MILESSQSKVAFKIPAKRALCVRYTVANLKLGPKNKINIDQSFLLCSEERNS